MKIDEDWSFKNENVVGHLDVYIIYKRKRVATYCPNSNYGDKKDRKLLTFLDIEIPLHVMLSLNKHIKELYES